MLFAYAYCYGPQMEQPELCLIPEKVDQFSFPVPLTTLFETKSAVIRIGHTEGIRVRIDPDDNGMIIDPILPSRVFLTPNQPDRPGLMAKNLKVVFRSDGSFDAFFKDEGREAQWKPWKPNDFVI